MLTADHELHLIRKTQNGSSEAFSELLTAYKPMLRGLARKLDGIPSEDALAIIQSHFYEVVVEHTEGRLGKYKWELFNRTQMEARIPSFVASIPERTWKRYWGIMRRANYDPLAGATICGDHGMVVSTFLKIHALAHAEPIEGVCESDIEPPEPEDAELLAELALSSLGDDEQRVVWHKWMTDEGTQKDGVVAYKLAIEDLGEDQANNGERIWAWWRIRRMRTKAMKTMRTALGVGDNE